MIAVDVATAHFLHAARAAAEQDADFVVRPVALVDANLLAFALRNKDQFGRYGRSGSLLEQRANPSAQSAAGDVGAAVGVLYYRVIRAADFQRAFARPDVQARFAVHLAFEDQLSDQLQFRLCSMGAHAKSLFVISNNGFEQIAESFIAAGFVFARDLQQQTFQLVEAAEAVARDGVREARAQHDELVLALAFRRSRGAAHGVVETAQLAARARIQIVHAAHHDMRLIVEI